MEQIRELTTKHACVCTDTVKQVIDRLVNKNFKTTKDIVINWSKEVYQYINKYKYFRNITLSDDIDINDICFFFEQPIKDFMNEKKH